MLEGMYTSPRFKGQRLLSDSCVRYTQFLSKDEDKVINLAKTSNLNLKTFLVLPSVPVKQYNRFFFGVFSRCVTRDTTSSMSHKAKGCCCKC